AEEVLHDAELRLRIDLPQRLAVRGSDAVQHPFGAVGVDAVAVHDRARARAVVVAVVVLVIGRVFELPEELARLALDTGRADLVVVGVGDEQPAAADARGAVAGAELHLPDEAQPLLRPRRDDARLPRHAGGQGAEEGGPVVAGGARAEVGRRLAALRGRPL